MTSSGKKRKTHSTGNKLMDRAVKAKLKHRLELARLPWPEKIMMIRDMQIIDNELAKAAGRKTRDIWQVK